MKNKNQDAMRANGARSGMTQGGDRAADETTPCSDSDSRPVDSVAENLATERPHVGQSWHGLPENVPAPDDLSVESRGMEALELEIRAQPNETTCGPTCLHAVYRFMGDTIRLSEVITECAQLKEGGTLAPLLGVHAVRRGYQATIYSFNLRIFDPTWFAVGTSEPVVDLAEKLQQQLEHKKGAKFLTASNAYREFVVGGGRIRMQDLTRHLLRTYLARGVPILVGVSATYLYHEAREIGPDFVADDIRGEPSGHFVVLCGYNRDKKTVRIADPYLPNPLAPEDHYYEIGVDRVVCAILLGILTYDANLLVLESKR